MSKKFCTGVPPIFSQLQVYGDGYAPERIFNAIPSSTFLVNKQRAVGEKTV
jgi:hypothetical protein